MKRRLFNLAALLSLLLCVATVGLWVRSYFINDRIERASLRGLRFRIFSIRSNHGLIAVNLECYDFLSEERASDYLRIDDRLTGGFRHYSSGGESSWPRDVGWLGFAAQNQAGSDSYFGTDTYVAIPYWLAVTVMTLLPVMWLVARIRRRDPYGVFCPTCGYDLRATPDRCPECGTPAPPCARC